MNPTSIVAYLSLFATAGFLFLFAALLLGRFLRARAPTPEKGEIYECGEPAVGSGFVQFDLRFYVVALVFIIFEVEVAFFFPWATVFGRATQLMDLNQRIAAAKPGTDSTRLIAAAADDYGVLNVEPQQERYSQWAEDWRKETSKHAETAGFAQWAEVWKTKHLPEVKQNATDARRLALTAVVDIGVFFAVLLVGFAYVWKRGDLDWVRAVGRQSSGRDEPPEKTAAEKATL